MNIKDQNKEIYGDVITDTQRSSWEETQTKMGVQDERVLEVIRQSSGLANFEICKLVNRPAHGVSGSLTRLRERARIEDSDTRKLNPQSNKRQVVWRASIPPHTHVDESGQIGFFGEDV